MLEIPAYEFDLTPFLGLWAGGGEHKVSVQVAGATETGHWLLGGALVLGHSAQRTVVGGSVAVEAPEPDVAEEMLGDESPYNQHMRASRGFHVRGELLLSDGHTIVSQVCGQLNAWSRSLRYFARTETAGDWRSTASSVYDGAREQATRNFPLTVSFEAQADEFSCGVSADLASTRHVVLQGDAPPALGACAAPIADAAGKIELKARLDSKVSYTASEGDDGQFLERHGTSTSDFEITAGTERCYRRELRASDGELVADDGSDACLWRFDAPYACGQEICGRARGALPGAPQHAPQPHLFRLEKAPENRTEAGSCGSLPPLRGPLASLWRQAVATSAKRTATERPLTARSADIVI